MSSTVKSQSATNWRAIKQLYLQGAKMPPPPQPTHQDYSQRQMQDYASPLLVEMERLYRQNLAELQEKYDQAMQFLSLRIENLQQDVRALRKVKQQKKQGLPAQGSNSDKFIPPSQADGSIKKHSSFIHIEQDEEQSLLDPQTTKKQPAKGELQLSTVRKELGKSSTNSRQLFEDTSSGTMKYQYSQGIHPLSTKQSVYFDSKEVREQMYALKSYIEMAHGIKMEMYAQRPQVTVLVRNIEVESSKNQSAHLKHENNMLRQAISKYQVQLQRAQEQLEKVRHLLLQGLEEQDYGPYTSCQ